MARQEKADTEWWRGEHRAGPEPYKGITRTSRYLTMRDGVKIAIDTYLPAGLPDGERLPTIIQQTRYFRRTDYRWPFGWLMDRRNLGFQGLCRMVRNGYAYVKVDARGSGASFGSRWMEWTPDEVRDGAEVVDWIVEQPWSNGVVGATGVSYDGTTAEQLLRNQHPAVKAVAIRFSLFDIYADIVNPGGVRNETFLRTWSDGNDALDQNQLAAFAREHTGLLAGLAVKGVATVDEDPDGEMLREAVKDHAENYNVYETTLELEFHDDSTEDGRHAAQVSPHAFMSEIEGSGAAIYTWSSWYDGAYTLSAIKRFLNVRTPGSRLILGPWDHGGAQNPDPFSPGHPSRFDHWGEQLRFFDHHLKGIATGIEDEKPIHYFTMGEEAWKSADVWPPPGFGPVPFYLAEEKRLERERAPDGDGSDRHRFDYTASTGTKTRWVSQVNVGQVRIEYPDRAEQDRRLLVYESAPLEKDVEVTGHPVVTLLVRPTTTDLQLFVYLEDVAPGGGVEYITEGVFRAVHRAISQEKPIYEIPVPHHSYRREDAQPLVPGEVAEICFDLQPISHLFRAGHSIRLAIAGADRDNFALLPEDPPEIEVLRSREHPSAVTLPVGQ
jgi:putative CocE/NonD family hydrolase